MTKQMNGMTEAEAIAFLVKAHKAGGFGKFGTIAAAKSLKATIATVKAEYAAK